MKKLLFLLLISASAIAQTTSGLPSLPATSSTLGSIQPDGITTTISSAGVLSSVGSAPPSTPQYIAPQALSGCGIQYLSGLTYTVGGCSYSINGITYASPLTNITLAAADPSNPRIDVIFVDTTQVVQKITGTPGATPSQPVVDPSTQLQLTFVLVNAAATTPTNTTVTNIYLENTEWTSSTGGTSSANVNVASTNNPYLGTKDTEFGTSGSVATTTFVQYLKPAAGTENLSNYNALVFYMRNKAAWPKARSVTVQWFNGSTALGIPVVVSNGAFGWNATTNTTAYQQVSIPASTFGLPGVLVTSVRFTITGTGANLTGFYLDEVTLQGGSGGVTLPATVMNFKGAYSATATYNPNDLVLSGGLAYVAITQNTNKAVTTTSVWNLLTNVPVLLSWSFNNGSTATDAAPRFLASRTASISNCYVLTTTSDGSTDLTLNIFDNGSTIFSGGAQTITHGTAAGTLTTLGALGTTAITNNDKISINITSGTSNWVFSVSCK